MNWQRNGKDKDDLKENLMNNIITRD